MRWMGILEAYHPKKMGHSSIEWPVIEVCRNRQSITALREDRVPGELRCAAVEVRCAAVEVRCVAVEVRCAAVEVRCAAVEVRCVAAEAPTL